MAQLVDSSIWISLERRGLTLNDLAQMVGDEPLRLASITASELLFGVHRADSPRRRRRRESFVEEILSLVPVLGFDIAAARTHARLWALLATAGTSIDAIDLIIAATAFANDLPVLTENVRHFERVPGLIVRQPAWS
jgi:tRNA(fMet)-specific endonuclease VapC